MFDSWASKLLFAAAGGVDPNPLMILPFAVMLLSIALMPFINKHWWEHHYPKVAVALGLITIVYYVGFLKNTGRMLHVAHEYVSFIALVGSLFVVSGGIHIRVKGENSVIHFFKSTILLHHTRVNGDNLNRITITFHPNTTPLLPGIPPLGFPHINFLR